MNCRSFIKNDQDILQEKETNSCLFPGIIEFLLTYYMPLLPLWSGIIPDFILLHIWDRRKSVIYLM